jgi:hypothetical protein
MIIRKLPPISGFHVIQGFLNLLADPFRCTETKTTGIGTILCSGPMTRYLNHYGRILSSDVSAKDCETGEADAGVALRIILHDSDPVFFDHEFRWFVWPGN